MLTTDLKNFKPWVGPSEHLCRPDLAMGCQFVTFDVELGPCSLMGYLGASALMALERQPACCCSHRAPGNASTLQFWHCISLQSCLLTASNFGPPRCPMSCQSTCCLFYRHMNLVFCVHLGSVAWMGTHLMTTMFNCWKNTKKGFFSPLLELYLLSTLCDLWEWWQSFCCAVSPPSQGARSC